MVIVMNKKRTSTSPDSMATKTKSSNTPTLEKIENAHYVNSNKKDSSSKKYASSSSSSPPPRLPSKHSFSSKNSNALNPVTPALDESETEPSSPHLRLPIRPRSPSPTNPSIQSHSHSHSHSHSTSESRSRSQPRPASSSQSVRRERALPSMGRSRDLPRKRPSNPTSSSSSNRPSPVLPPTRRRSSRDSPFRSSKRSYPSRSSSRSYHPSPSFPSSTTMTQRRTVSPFRSYVPRARSRSRPPRAGLTRVFVGNLAYSCTWQHLKDFGRQAGDVANAIILESFGQSKGCGVLEYRNEGDAQRALRRLQQQKLLGRRVYLREDQLESLPSSVKSPPPPPPPPPPLSSRRDGGTVARGQSGLPDPRKAFVMNLDFSVTSKDLENLFKKVGKIVRGDIFFHAHSGRSKGTGMVLFVHKGDVQRAIKRFNRYVWHGREIEVRGDRGSGNVLSRPKPMDNFSASRHYSPPPFSSRSLSPHRSPFSPLRSRSDSRPRLRTRSRSHSRPPMRTREVRSPVRSKKHPRQHLRSRSPQSSPDRNTSTSPHSSLSPIFQPPLVSADPSTAAPYYYPPYTAPHPPPPPHPPLSTYYPPPSTTSLPPPSISMAIPSTSFPTLSSIPSNPPYYPPAPTSMALTNGGGMHNPHYYASTSNYVPPTTSIPPSSSSSSTTPATSTTSEIYPNTTSLSTSAHLPSTNYYDPFHATSAYTSSSTVYVPSQPLPMNHGLVYQQPPADPSDLGRSRGSHSHQM
ncbi:hypothetical protein HMI54_006114 [Coelomomyces lativittatus]|nr:hypothetical protein HMI56_007316 [Coelomomyces lativittatus]KAJ1513828.1 hypothetical protein HMI55_005189 [Coelomomyces lativittatus]KAJ1517308.1 hypothetical protein HMI54_006114 [Coelomomyces lativittatus]